MKYPDYAYVDIETEVLFSDEVIKKMLLYADKYFGEQNKEDQELLLKFQGPLYNKFAYSETPEGHDAWMNFVLSAQNNPRPKTTEVTIDGQLYVV